MTSLRNNTVTSAVSLSIRALGGSGAIEGSPETSRAPADTRNTAAGSPPIPIATGENEYTRYGFRDLIKHDAAAIFNPDAKVLGGVTEFMKVAALVQSVDLDIAPHGSQDIHVHLVAAISNGLILEFYRDTVDPMWGRVYHNTLTLNADGTVSPPNVPGIGADPNFASLEEFRIA